MHAFKRLLASANTRRPVDARIPPTLRLYDLHHAHATALLAAGVHPKVASERLGHASVTLTLDTYTHSVLRLDVDAGLLMQRVLRGDGEARRAGMDLESGAVPAPIPAPGPGSPARRAGGRNI